MSDLLVMASAPDAGIAIVAAVTTGLLAETRARHDFSPSVTAAVGRLMTGAVLLGAGLKEGERFSLRVTGDGPIGSLTAEAWLVAPGRLGARGYARNPHADVPLTPAGKFDVAGAIGAGTLHVTKSHESGQPYAGVVPLHSGEIAEDLASYLVNSEQIPSGVALGVLADRGGVKASGGILAQVLPGADERAVAILEERALEMPPITRAVAEGATARDLLDALAGDFDLRTYHEIDVTPACLCTRAKVEVALLGLGAEELDELIRERPVTEATCEFCKTAYDFDASQMRELIARLSGGG